MVYAIFSCSFFSALLFNQQYLNYSSKAVLILNFVWNVFRRIFSKSITNNNHNKSRARNNTIKKRSLSTAETFYWSSLKIVDVTNGKNLRKCKFKRYTIVLIVVIVVITFRFLFSRFLFLCMCLPLSHSSSIFFWLRIAFQWTNRIVESKIKFLTHH